MPITQKKYMNDERAQELITEIKSRNPATFVGTKAEWNALPAANKAKYTLVNLTDDGEALGIDPVNAVEDGNMNAVTSNAVYGSLNFGRRITASSAVEIQDGEVYTPICDYSEFTGNYIGILFGFGTARTPIDFPKIMFNTSSNRTTRFYIYINDQCNGYLWLRNNDNGKLEAKFTNQGTATSSFVVWAYTHN